MVVQKRDKTIEPFDSNKVRLAMSKAFNACGEEFHEELVEAVVAECEKWENSPIDVEDIQDEIERVLMKTHPNIGKAYIIYRAEHKVMRDNDGNLMRGILLKLIARDVVNQNANLDEKSFSGRVGEAAAVATREAALKYLMSKKARRAHENNEIYTHDLDSYFVGDPNCLSVPLDYLFEHGFKVKQTDVRPPKSICTGFQLVAVLFQVQSLQQFGGVAATHLDWTMVPLVRMSFFKHYALCYIKDHIDDYCEDILKLSAWELDDLITILRNELLMLMGLEKKDFYFGNQKLIDYNKRYYNSAILDTRLECDQAVEATYHNLNTLQSRAGAQLPFSSINYGTCTEPEGRMVIKSLLEGSLRGVGAHHKTPIFPCGIFQLMDGVNTAKNDPNYDLFRLALKSTSERIYPNYVNCDWSGNAGYDKNDPRTYMSTMGCHEYGTSIIMADGTYKPVQDIIIGDKVMGWDGTPRTVESLVRGHGQMYKVNQSHGESYVVNEDHILALKASADVENSDYRKGQIVTISVKEYLTLPENVCKQLHGFKGTPDSAMSELSIEKCGDDDYYGFNLDCDRLYQFNDGTVTHNCRTANGFDINGLGQLKDGRGNICPVTIILPTLAMAAVLNVAKRLGVDKDEILAHKDEKYDQLVFDEFMKIFDKKLYLAKDNLIARFEWICAQSPDSAKFVWENNVMAGYVPEEGIRSALKHGTLSVGNLGLAECLQLIIGDDHTSEKGMAYAKKIFGHYKKRCAEFKETYKLNFGVYNTPAESLCYKALKLFRNKYGVIENVSDREYFTNSMHVPVWKKMSPFKKIDIESELTGYSSAGCITYVELPSSVTNNIDALEEIVLYAKNKDVPYIAINVPIDECLDCGYRGEMNDVCPECGGHHIRHLRRVTGYLSVDVSCLNIGKQYEVGDREEHKQVEIIV